MRYAILSDIHANLPALQAVLDDLSDQSVTALIYLGDAVGYYADSAAVIALLSDLVMSGYGKRDGREAHGLLWVPGNHEWGLLERTEEHFFSPAARIALQQTRTDLTADELELLAHLPQRIELDLEDNLSLTICHATPGDPVGLTGYIENSEDARDAAQHLTTPLCLVGHTHYPRICAEEAASVAGQARWEVIDVFEAMLPGGQYPLGDQRLILNPGSVGQPRDGDPRAAYAILDTGAKTFSVRRIPYDIADTQARLRAWLSDAPAALLDGQGGLAGRLELGI
jgi:predicted phosphodiesterase